MTSKSVISFQTADVVPAHLMSGTALGNENVSASDMAIPVLALAQAMSPEVGKKSDPKHIKGLEMGHVFNKLTGEFWDTVFVVNLKFETGFTIFKKREEGGGFEGNHESLAAANQHLADNGLNEAVHDIVETAKHTVACIDDDGKASVAVIYMSGANKKVSDAWNTALAQSGTDRFGTVWALESVEEKNRMGQGYQVFKATNKGYPTPELYAEARATYFAMQGMTDPTIH
mgnify:FL=1|jgi:hypothetical protein